MQLRHGSVVSTSAEGNCHCLAAVLAHSPDSIIGLGPCESEALLSGQRVALYSGLAIAKRLLCRHTAQGRILGRCQAALGSLDLSARLLLGALSRLGMHNENLKRSLLTLAAVCPHSV